MSAFTTDAFTDTTGTEDTDDLSLDTAEHTEDDTHTDEGAHTHEEEATGEAATTTKSKPATRPSSQKPLIRRAAKKTLDVLNADGEVMKVVAAILGHSADDTEQIVISILTSDRRTLLQPVTDLRELRAADQLEMGIHATALGRERLRDLWALLELLDRADGTLPSSDPKAALKIVKSIISVTDEDMTLIDLADELLKKA